MIASESPVYRNFPTARQLEPVVRAAVEKSGVLQQAATDWIRRYPAWSIGLAVAMGVTLGWISKRR